MGERIYYHQCPDCGFKQKSMAKKRIRCHKCGSTYREKTSRCSPPKPKEGDGRFKKASSRDEDGAW